MKLRIKEINEVESFECFSNTHSKSNIFQTPEMYELYRSTKNFEPVFLAAVNDANEVQGTLLAVIQKEHPGILGKFSARSIIWGGPLIKDDNPDVLYFLLKEYNKKIKGKAIYTQFRNLWGWSEQEKRIFEKHGFRYEAHLDILIDLTKSEDELLLEMHKGRRKNIRRASRLSLQFVEIKNKGEFEKCIELIKNTYKRVKLPSPDKSFFHEANAQFKKTAGFKKFALKYGDEIISTRFALCYSGLVYDWYAGTNEDHLDKYPNDYLPWKILEWGVENGYKTFDFGGAGKPGIPYGVRDYKMKFGGDLVEFGRFEKVHNKLLFNIGRIGFILYKKIK